MTTVALVERQELVRIGLTTVLRQDPELDTIIEAESLDGLCGSLSVAPDLLLIDVSRHGSSSEKRTHGGASDAEEQAQGAHIQQIMTAVDALQDRFPNMRTALLSAGFDLHCLLETLSGNVQAYLLKNVSPDELRAAVRAVLCGGVYIHASLMENLPRNALRSSALSTHKTCNTSLSEREQCVLELLVTGHTNKEVSEQLYLSTKTVEAYRARIYTKLGANSRAELFSSALDRGLVSL
jgi:two-component system response regulator NreC